MAFFQEHEFHCHCGRPECEAARAPHPELWSRLELMRSLYGAPLIVTSGNRCEFWNAKEKGKADSTHLKGSNGEGCRGADLECPTSRQRYEMLVAGGQAGFRRFGIGPRFLHVDVAEDEAHPPDVVWVYY